MKSFGMYEVISNFFQAPKCLNSSQIYIKIHKGGGLPVFLYQYTIYGFYELIQNWLHPMVLSKKLRILFLSWNYMQIYIINYHQKFEEDGSKIDSVVPSFLSFGPKYEGNRPFQALFSSKIQFLSYLLNRCIFYYSVSASFLCFSGSLHRHPY